MVPDVFNVLPVVSGPILWYQMYLLCLPVVSGPILWYQMFEYAIGHWLMKATEHVFGCVLCAPGCFSLFRGSALMDDNVARMYSTRAREAGQYVQYDQGIHFSYLLDPVLKEHNTWYCYIPLY